MVGQQVTPVLGLITETVPLAVGFINTEPVAAVADNCVTEAPRVRGVPALPMLPAVESSTTVLNPLTVLNFAAVIVLDAIATSVPPL
jgi:hypothetical protein